LNNVLGFRICSERRNALWPDKEREESEHKTIERNQIRGALSGSITNQHLMFNK